MRKKAKTSLNQMQIPADACRLAIEMDVLADLQPTAEGNRPFRGIAHSGAIMRRQTWDGPVNFAIDMASLRITRQDVPTLRDHYSGAIVGFTKRMAKDGNKLVVEGELVRATDDGREAIALLEAGFPMQMSVYVPAERYKRIAEGEEGQVNGQTIKGPAVILMGSTVREVTLTALGADENTGASLLADGGTRRLTLTEEDDDGTKTMEPDETSVVDEGTAAPGEAATVTAALPSRVVRKVAPSAADQLAAIRAEAARAERERIVEVRKLGESYGMEPRAVALAVDEGWTIDRAARAFGEVLADAKRTRLAALKQAQPSPVGTDDPDAGGRATVSAEARAVLAMPEAEERFKLEFERYGWGGRDCAKLRSEFGNDHGRFAAYRRHPWRPGTRGYHSAQGWQEAQDGDAKFAASAVLSPRNVRGSFFKRLEETARASWVPLISHVFDSDQASEDYRFLGQVPSMREWVGARRKTEPKNYSIKIVNDKYESAVEFSRDDMRRDKTGQIMVRVADLGSRVAMLPNKTLTTVLEANGPAYDGVAYFGTHVAASVITNALTDTTVAAAGEPTSSEMMNGVLAAIQTILGAKDDQGEPMNDGASRFAVMVPTKYWSALLAALRNDFTSAGVSNTLQALVNGGRIAIEPILNARLVAPVTGGTGVFYVFRTDSDIKPLIWQDEVEIELDLKGDGSDYAFDFDSHVYGSKRIGAGAGGAFEMAARMTFS